MRRRDLLLGAAAAASPLAVLRAQQAAKTSRVGYIAGAKSPSTPGNAFFGFERRLRELGYVDGRTVIYEYRGHEGRLERLPEVAAELVRLNVDVIVSFGPEAVLSAAASATATIPIIAVAVDYDPVARGYIASLREPGGNITGIFMRQVEATAKRLELLKEALPALTRIAVLLDAFTNDASEQMRAVEASAKRLGVALSPILLQQVPDDFAAAATRARDTDAVLALMSPALFVHRAALVATLARAGLPASFGLREFAEAGGFMSYGANLQDMSARAADYVDRILKGARPAELPVEQPTRFELIVNLKAARALGVELPLALLARADEVIE